MNLVKKFIDFAMGNFIVLFLGLISSPIITRIIDPEQMGKYSMFTTVSNLILLIILLGMDQAYIRYFYEEEEGNRSKLLKQCYKIPVILGIVIFILILLFYKNISKYIIGEESINIVILLGISIMISIFSRFSLVQVRMKQKGKFYSFLNIIAKVSYLILIIIMFNIYNNSYMTLVIAFLISNLCMMTIVIYKEREEWLIKSNKVKLKTSTKEMLMYSFPLLFASAITWIFQSVDRICIREFSGYTEVGLYSAAMNIIALLNALQGAFTTFWVPVAHERYNSKPEDKVFFSDVNKIISVVMLIVGILLITFKDIIVFILGINYRDAIFIFPYLVFMPIMYTISETTVIGINFAKQTKKHIWISLVSAIFNIIGNLILVPKLGARGAAISTGLSYVIFYLLRTHISTKYYKVDYNNLKFMISTISVYILAMYSSFNKFDLVIIILSITSIAVVLIMYKDTFKLRNKYNKETNIINNIS